MISYIIYMLFLKYIFILICFFKKIYIYIFDYVFICVFIMIYVNVYIYIYYYTYTGVLAQVASSCGSHILIVFTQILWFDMCTKSYIIAVIYQRASSLFPWLT